MKLLTLNTHSWMEDNQLEKLERLAQKINEERFDVIALQEINQSIAAPIISDPLHFLPIEGEVIKEDNYALQLVTLLAEKYQLTYYWSWAYNHCGFDRFDEGVAILSRTKPDQVMPLRLSDVSDPNDYHTRIALVAKINDQTFVSLHTSWWDDGFQYEEQRLQTLLVSDKPVFLMGDLNNPSHLLNEGYTRITELWFDSYQLAFKIDGHDTMMGKIAGWEENQSGQRIDYILLNKLTPIIEAKTLFDGRNEPPISDHFAYSITLN